MKIRFRKTKLELLANNKKRLVRTYGPRNADEILWAIGELESAEFLADIPDALRPHQLVANLAIYSTDVEHPFRLIFKPAGEYDASNPFNTIQEIEILELSIDTHDKKFNANSYVQ